MLENENGTRDVIFAHIFSLLGTFSLSALLIFIAAAVLNTLKDPLGYIFPTAIGVLYLSCLVGGGISFAFSKKLRYALTAGGSTAILVFLLSGAFSEKAALSPVIYILFLLAIPLSYFLGAILISKAKSSNRSKRKRRHR